jgi:hypothetical protein
MCLCDLLRNTRKGAGAGECDPQPSAPADPSRGSEVVVEDEYAQGRTSDTEGADRDVPAGEDYAGSGL